MKTLLSGDQELTLTVICAVFGIAAATSDRWAPGGGLRVPLFVISYLAGGIGPGLDLIRNLLGRRLDINLLMVTAATGSAVLGH